MVKGVATEPLADRRVRVTALRSAHGGQAGHAPGRHAPESSLNTRFPSSAHKQGCVSLITGGQVAPVCLRSSVVWRIFTTPPSSVSTSVLNRTARPAPLAVVSPNALRTPFLAARLRRLTFMYSPGIERAAQRHTRRSTTERGGGDRSSCGSASTRPLHLTGEKPSFIPVSCPFPLVVRLCPSLSCRHGRQRRGWGPHQRPVPNLLSARMSMLAGSKGTHTSAAAAGSARRAPVYHHAQHRGSFSDDERVAHHAPRRASTPAPCVRADDLPECLRLRSPAAVSLAFQKPENRAPTSRHRRLSRSWQLQGPASKATTGKGIDRHDAPPGVWRARGQRLVQQPWLGR
jgi:hypothetical protein